MDVLLLTSEREGLPNVLIEAQHFGVPVVSTDVGGAGETMLRGQTGQLVPADASPEEIANAVLAILPQASSRAALRAAAQNFVHPTFGLQSCVGKVLTILGVPVA